MVKNIPLIQMSHFSSQSRQVPPTNLMSDNNQKIVVSDTEAIPIQNNF